MDNPLMVEVVQVRFQMHPSEKHYFTSVVGGHRTVSK
jgi:hypothetical protein